MATIAELRLTDKQKVANLLHKVSALSRQLEIAEDTGKERARKQEKRCRRLRSEGRSLSKENVRIQKQLEESSHLIRLYQSRLKPLPGIQGSLPDTPATHFNGGVTSVKPEPLLRSPHLDLDDVWTQGMKEASRKLAAVEHRFTSQQHLANGDQAMFATAEHSGPSTKQASSSRCIKVESSHHGENENLLDIVLDIEGMSIPQMELKKDKHSCAASPNSHSIHDWVTGTDGHSMASPSHIGDWASSPAAP